MKMLFCNNCQHSIFKNSKYCGACGTKVSFKKEQEQESSLRLVISFYIAYLLFALISYLISSEKFSLGTEIFIEAIFILITIGFTFFDYKNIYTLFNFKRIHWKNMLFALFFPFITAIVVYFPIEWINEYIGEIDNVFLTYDAFPNTFFWVFIFYVIIPPIFEELAFRGFLFNQLLLITNWKITIIATAFIFALVHFSLISLIWIFPFGIILGYLRYRYKTLWLGMIVHFIHNLLVILLDFYYFNSTLAEYVF